MLNFQGSRLWWLHSRFTCVLFAWEGTTVCIEIPLQSPPPQRGDRHLATVSGAVARYRGRLQGGGGLVSVNEASRRLTVSTRAVHLVQ